MPTSAQHQKFAFRTDPRARKKSLIRRLKDIARMAFGQDDDDDYECTRG